MSDYPMLISNKLHSFRNFMTAKLQKSRIISGYCFCFCSYPIWLSFQFIGKNKKNISIFWRKHADVFLFFVQNTEAFVRFILRLLAFL